MSRSAKIVLIAVGIVFLVGALLPALQRSGHPRPAIAVFLSVLFFLELPVNGVGFESDFVPLTLRIISTLVWGVALGIGSAFVVRNVRRKDKQGTPPA